LADGAATKEPWSWLPPSKLQDLHAMCTLWHVALHRYAIGTSICAAIVRTIDALPLVASFYAARQ
jgi:hypothetical protein